MLIQALKQHYEAQIKHLRLKAIEFDNNAMDNESFHQSIQELQDKNLHNKSHEKNFEALSHNLMSKLMEFEIHLKNLLNDCNKIKMPKNKDSKNEESQIEICNLLAILHTKAQTLKEDFALVQVDLAEILEVLKLMQKNGELVSLLTLKLGKKQDAIYANKILHDISSSARLADKTLEGIGLGLRSAAECICQEYEQLLAKIHKNVKCLEKIGGKAILD
ncbi:hypothetical protein [Helicobacter sp. MIT 05-5294]|uniref:hypothetical protein n=1 Tax=Helicobacter sp. MIT 05-5294 TaxID=1548150 RepID=UPI00051FE62A|nr:hypothetical protein [Helicobacter sp. MIT 05-5294]TLD86988.1 hypothetical protein LS69_004885 [Helicobacter sp. MIT 05-5294]